MRAVLNNGNLYGGAMGTEYGRYSNTDSLVHNRCWSCWPSLFFAFGILAKGLRSQIHFVMTYRRNQIHFVMTCRGTHQCPKSDPFCHDLSWYTSVHSPARARKYITFGCIPQLGTLGCVIRYGDTYEYVEEETLVLNIASLIGRVNDCKQCTHACRTKTK